MIKSNKLRFPWIFLNTFYSNMLDSPKMKSDIVVVIILLRVVFIKKKCNLIIYLTVRLKVFGFRKLIQFVGNK